MRDNARGRYTVREAAAILGLSPEDVRSLIQTHILQGAKDIPGSSPVLLRPCEVVALRFLCAGAALAGV